MTQLKTHEAKAPFYGVEDTHVEDASAEKENQQTNLKAPCFRHDPSQSPLIDRELQKPRSIEIIKALSMALNDLTSEKHCTICTVEQLSSLLTDHVGEMREAKRSGEWSKEDKKALKAEMKAVLKPAKKNIKALWKAR